MRLTQERRKGTRAAQILSFPSLACVVLTLFGPIGCTAGDSILSQPSDSTTTSTPPSSLARGIPGLELGMTPDEIARSFALNEVEEPFATLMGDLVSPEEGANAVNENESVQIRYFEVLPLVEPLPAGASSVSVYTTYDVAYQIGLHYSGPGIEWERIAFPYVAKYGRPTRDSSSGYVWENERTRLTVDASFSTVNVFFNDLAIQAELDARDFRR